MTDARSYYARAYSREPITQRNMESFAPTCVAWASKVDNRSNPQTIITAAHGRLNNALALEQRLADGGRLVGDLRIELD